MPGNDATVSLIVAFEIAGCGDVRSAAREGKCEEDLRTLGDALVKYVSLYGDVPRGKDGKASIIPLTEPKIQNAIGIDSSTLKCPADRNSTGPSYVLNPALSVHDFGPQSTTVIACEHAPNHRRAHVQNAVTVVLIGSRATVEMTLPEEDQEAWRRLFLSGDKRACHISLKDGSTGHWSDDDITWFVGQKKGYVPNE
jgi:hypothetical protein